MKNSVKEPQFIYWVKEKGIFKPAEIKVEEITLGKENISRDLLKLVGSIYLGPSMTDWEYQDSAIGFARDARVPYFSIDSVCITRPIGNSSLERDVESKMRLPLFKNIQSIPCRSVSDITKAQREYEEENEEQIQTETIYHPTVHLWDILKKN